MNSRLIKCLVLLTMLACARLSLADDTFKNKIAPIFAKRCAICHNDSDLQGDFSIATRDAVLESQSVEPGDSDASYLLELITSHDGEKPEMPKSGPALSDDEVRLIRKWIDDGAKWPDEFKIVPQDARSFDWWSFQSVSKPKVPTFASTTEREWVKTPIDAFILNRLKQVNLTPSRSADRRTLIRRVTYDLTGLPPTFEEIEAFLADDSPDAYLRLVDRLLDSPRYGEHWARHWLDVVKYADTCGYDKDKLRPNAWPYRDYVIRSFNEDKPYVQFVREQIAGDVFYPGKPDGILGLGFIAAGPWDFIGHVEVPESKIDGMVARNLDRDEMVTNTMNTFCSLTIQCARCHDHKFDPFSQQQYYGLQSVFAAVDRSERVYEQDPAVAKQRAELELQIARSTKTIETTQQKLDSALGDQLEKLQAQIKQLESKDATGKRPEFGYHSQLANNRDVEKWVEVDLGTPVEISRIIINPCHDEFGGIGAGFGFPVRFQIQIDDEVIADRSADDFANPGIEPIELAAGVTGQKVRLVADRLFDRKGSFILALAEMQIIDKTGKNVALGKQVNSLDSIEAPIRWCKANLVDGIWYSDNSGPDKQKQLVEAKAKAERLIQDTIGDEGRVRLEQSKTNLTSAKAKLAKLPTGKTVYAAATQFKPEGGFQPTGGKPRTIRTLIRGNIQTPGEVANPGRLPLKENDPWTFSLADDATEADRRAALAEWITADDHPLFWRSIVNRVWHYHFGRGIVATPNDLGRMGAEPTHPELLDWLANEFRSTGGSFKKIHRQIVTSSVYQQTSKSDLSKSKQDSNNRFLWRMNRRRLSAEEIRDSVLMTSGKLDLAMGGPGYYLFALEKTEHSPHYEYHKFDHSDPQSYRRSVYRFVVRSQPDPFMTTLDCADSSQSTPVRNETQTSLQALAMLNNRFNLVMSKHFAQRVETQSQAIKEQVDLTIRALLGRSASESETAMLSEYIEQHSLQDLVRMLFNLSEFIYID